MGLKHETYAKELVNLHGEEHALKIMNKCLEIVEKGRTTLFFDEADFHLNPNGKYDLSKHQSKKVEGKQLKNINKDRNFFREVIKLIVKGKISE